MKILTNNFSKKNINLILIVSIMSIYLSCSNVLAQHSLIDSVYTIPSSPVSSQEVRLVIRAWFSYTPGSLDSSKITMNGDTIMLSTYYSVGGYTSFSNRIDTFNLGFLNAGSYVLKVKSFAEYLVLGTQTDTYTYNFTVGTLGIHKNNKTSELKLFPNPATNQLNFSITTNTPKLAVEIFDISGRKVSTTQYNSSNQGMYSKSIDVSALNKGLYLCRFIFNDHQVTRKFIKR